MTNLQSRVINKFADKIEAIFGDRIVSLVAYGSAVNNRATSTSDVDLFLMLNARVTSSNDMTLLRSIVVSETSFKADLSVQYLDEQREDPKSFHDGTKGSLALAYLASATLLKGENIFKDLLYRLDDNDFRESAYKSVGYYLDMMRRESIASGFDNETFKLRLKKYTARSLVDAFLFKQRGDMAPYKGMKFEEVLALAVSNDFTRDIMNKNLADTPERQLALIEDVYSRMEKHL